ncbi:MAG: hypothetical protein VKM17_06785 [Cyanobacteriota bacterium]|nr:hypothetical protein [Cyanobacteriota bacterium]
MNFERDSHSRKPHHLLEAANTFSNVRCVSIQEQNRSDTLNKARLSLLMFGLYMVFAVGIGFMFIPMQILSIFQLAAGDDVWIRFVGMLASIVGFYYIQAARAGLDKFIHWTVPGRFYAAAFMVLLVALRMVGPSLLLFAAIDLAGATWAWLALRLDKTDGSTKTYERI